jgi:hypothetical protein
MTWFPCSVKLVTKITKVRSFEHLFHIASSVAVRLYIREACNSTQQNVFHACLSHRYISRSWSFTLQCAINEQPQRRYAHNYSDRQIQPKKTKYVEEESIQKSCLCLEFHFLTFNFLSNKGCASFSGYTYVNPPPPPTHTHTRCRPRFKQHLFALYSLLNRPFRVWGFTGVFHDVRLSDLTWELGEVWHSMRTML